MKLFARRGPLNPVVFLILMSKENTMPVSQDIQDFCAGLGPAVQGYTQAQVDAAVAKASADAAANLAAATTTAVADALGQVQQDHADEVQALKDALAKATAPPA